MNDIVSDIESYILIFADDTSLMASGPDPATSAEQLNRLNLMALSPKISYFPTNILINDTNKKVSVMRSVRLFNSQNSQPVV